MKKNLLLLTTAFTLSLGVQAQTDVTAQYILNPGFEDCTPSESNAQGAIDLHTDYATALGTDYNDCGWKLVEQAKSANGGAISYASGLKVNTANGTLLETMVLQQVRQALRARRACASAATSRWFTSRPKPLHFRPEATR